MLWIVELTNSATKDLGSFDNSVRRRVLAKLRWLRSNIEDVEHVALTAEWSSYYKLKVGDWRIGYRVDYDSRVITIHAIDRRDKMYKRSPPHRT